MNNQNCLHFSFLLILVVGYTVDSTTSTPKPTPPPPFMTYKCDAGGQVNAITISDEQAAHVYVLTKTADYCKPASKTMSGVKDCITSFYNNADPKTDIIKAVTIFYGDMNIEGVIGGINARYYTLSCLGKVGVVTAAMIPIIVGTAMPTKQTIFHVDNEETVKFTFLDPTSPKYVGEKVTLQMEINSNYVLLPQSCTAYHTDSSALSHEFWDNCQVTDAAIIPSRTWRKSSTQANIQIDMYAFRFVDSKDLIIKCQTTICPIDDVAPCNMSCDGKRKKRDTNNYQPQKNSTSAILSLSLQVFDRQFEENSSQALSPILYIYTIGFGIIYWITVTL